MDLFGEQINASSECPLATALLWTDTRPMVTLLLSEDRGICTACSSSLTTEHTPKQMVHSFISHVVDTGNYISQQCNASSCSTRPQLGRCLDQASWYRKVCVSNLSRFIGLQRSSIMRVMSPLRRLASRRTSWIRRNFGWEERDLFDTSRTRNCCAGPCFGLGRPQPHFNISSIRAPERKLHE